MTTEVDFYDTPAADQLAAAYQTNTTKSNHRHDWLFLVCLFLALKI